MKKEEKYLIELLKAHLNNQTVRLDEGIDYSRLFTVCKNHNLLAIAFCVIKNADNKSIIPNDIYNQFEDAFYETIIRYDIQNGVQNELNAILNDNKIKHIFFKGAEIKKLYPVPEARAMGDIDVLIAQEDRDRVKDILIGNGFSLENSNGPVYDYRKSNVLIEMHTKIVSGKVGSSNAEKAFLDAINYAKFDGYCGALNPDYHFAYLITHIAHHFWFYGAGIKLIFDLAVYQKAVEIDYDSVMNKLQEIGLERFAKVILSVCSKWFSVGVDYNADTRVTERFIASFGAFGNSNRNNSAVIERKELEEGKKSSAFMTRLRLLFPAYSKLKNIPYIKFIEGKPWLTPFAWIYRIIYNLKHKKDFVVDATSKIGDKKTSIQARKELEYFEEIGLL